MAIIDFKMHHFDMHFPEKNIHFTKKDILLPTLASLF